LVDEFFIQQGEILEIGRARLGKAFPWSLRLAMARKGSRLGDASRIFGDQTRSRGPQRMT
jgi:hypothetical protein